MRCLGKAKTTKKLLRKLMLGVAWHESRILPRSTSSTYSSDFTWMSLVNYPSHTRSLVTSQFIYTGCRYLTLNLNLTFTQTYLPQHPLPKRAQSQKGQSSEALRGFSLSDFQWRAASAFNSPAYALMAAWSDPNTFLFVPDHNSVLYRDHRATSVGPLRTSTTPSSYSAL